MSLWDSVTSFLALNPWQERSITLADPMSDSPDLDTQLQALRNRQFGFRPWRRAGIEEALGVPAIFRAVSLIATTMGALSLNGFRDGTIMDPMDRPRLIIRPDPFRKPRDFFRDTAWNMATRGEAWWWVARRDIDGSALSLLCVPPAEITVEENPDDLRFPIIKWRNRTIRNEDMRQITLVQEPGSLRGVGPLQLCGAAVSVAVEAQEWAAAFFADGGYPSILIKSALQLSGEEDEDGDSEAERLRNQWTSAPHNTPKIIDPGIESVEEIGSNPQGAQMLQARDYQIGDAARMFGMPGSLLDYSTPGSSLTYQNLESEFAKWVRAGLWPYYLEPVEQEISDLLARSITARFNVDALTRADIKTRYEVYTAGTASGVLSVEEAQRMEGLIGGNIENAPVPFAPPQAVPASLPIQARSAIIRCGGKRVLHGVLRPCNKLLAESGEFIGTCPRCKKVYAAPVSEGMLLARSVAELATRDQPQPVINIAPPQIVVNVPEQPAPIVNVNLPETQPERDHAIYIDRDDDGKVLRLRNEAS